MTAIVAFPSLVLVYLAAGVQGSAAVRAALARGFAVRALVRDRARAPSFGERVEFAEGDLDDLESLQMASAGVTHAVLQVPTGPVEAMEAQAANAASASVAAGLRSVVLRLASASRPAPCAEPSFVGNARVEDALRQACLAFASMRPTMYLDNLLKPSVLSEIIGSGVFAPPIAAAQRIAWTSADDCARAAIALLARGATGDYRIAGPHSLCGEELAASLSAGLGRRIAYQNVFTISQGIALERNRDEWMLRIRRTGSCPCKQPGRHNLLAMARLRSNPKGSGVGGRSAALRRL